MEIARSSFPFRDILATAPNDTIFINKSKDVVKRLPISRQKHKKWPKRPKMEYLPIFDHFSPFVHDPLIPPLLLLTKVLSPGVVAMIYTK